MCSDAAIHIALWRFGVKQGAPLRRQKSPRVARNQQKSPNIARKSTKVGRNRQKSSVVNRSQRSFNGNRSAVQGMLGDHRRKHTYWNIKGCGDAARVFTGKFLFFRSKGCGDFWLKCATNVPPQVLPRFSSFRRSKFVVSEQGIPRASAESVEGPGLPIRTGIYPRRLRTRDSQG
jgi:hypothetical protein